jgi:predicted DCC family thiol-disulfide oxidoreductase YuxK
VPSQSTPAGRLTVLYDAHCRVCTRIAGRLAGADDERRLRIRPLQHALEDEWPGVRRLRAERDLRWALHVIDEEGQFASGGEAMLRVFERVPTFAPLARIGRLPLVAGMVEPGYRCFADNRARFAFLAGSFRAGSLRSAQGIRRR